MPLSDPKVSGELVLPLVGLLGTLPFPDGLEQALAALLGPIVQRSPSWDFRDTDYYAPEMGGGLTRAFLAFAQDSPAGLSAWKRGTGELEQRWRTPGGRRVNLDPGYVSLGGLFLASTKPGLHRIPLANGIHAEITLYYTRGAWQALPWTFPDFRSGRYDAFLTECRKYLKRTHATSPHGEG